MSLAWAVHRLAVLLAGPVAESADEVQAAHASLTRTLVHALSQAHICAVADVPRSTSLGQPLDTALVQDAVDLLLGTLPKLAGPAVPAPLLLDVLCSTDRFVLVQACLQTIIRAAGSSAGGGSTAVSKTRPVLAPRQWSLVVRKVCLQAMSCNFLVAMATYDVSCLTLFAPNASCGRSWLRSTSGTTAMRAICWKSLRAAPVAARRAS